jgi:hypothetical protein
MKSSSTLIVITAKHGQSPIDPNRVLRIDGDVKGKGMSAEKGPDAAVSFTIPHIACACERRSSKA